MSVLIPLSADSSIAPLQLYRPTVRSWTDATRQNPMSTTVTVIDRLKFLSLNRDIGPEDPPVDGPGGTGSQRVHEGSESSRVTRCREPQIATR